MELSNHNPYIQLPPDIKIFTAIDLQEVELLSAGMSETEVLDYFNLSDEKLISCPQDKTYFQAAFRRGRSRAKHEAVRCLFAQMKDKGGSAAALAYLRQVGELWPAASLETGTGKNFSFKVVMDD